MSNKIKVAFLSNQIGLGGGSKSLLFLLKSIKDLDFQVFLFATHCSSKEMLDEYKEYVESIKIINLPEIISAQTQTTKSSKDPLILTRINESLIVEFANTLNLLKINILHINTSVFSPIYKIIKTHTQVKIVSHIREWINWNGIYEKQTYIIKNILEYSDAIICISDPIAAEFINHPNLFIVPNPFDFESFKNLNINTDNIREKLGFDKTHCLVGMLTFRKSKGTMDFLKAVSFLKSQKKDGEKLKFIVIGGIPLKFDLLYYVRKLLGKDLFPYEVNYFLKKNKLMNEGVFLGNRINVEEIINCFDIAVSPTLSGDPWSRMIIEFMALKKPIVATGTSEYFVKNGVSGFLVKPGDYRDLAEKIYALYVNKEKRQEMGQKAYNYIYSKSNLDSYRLNMLNVYQSLNR